MKNVEMAKYQMINSKRDFKSMWSKINANSRTPFKCGTNNKKSLHPTVQKNITKKLLNLRIYTPSSLLVQLEWERN